MESILSSFGSTYVYLSAIEHDRITADTQAATHAAFLRYHGDSAKLITVWGWHGKPTINSPGTRSVTKEELKTSKSM